MFVSPIDKEQCPGKRAWDNLTIHDGGKFYAFFGTGVRSETNPGGHPNALDIAVSEDGVRWRFLARDLLPIPGAHAGFGVVRAGDRILYYPTCSDDARGAHFKICASADFLHWEHLGDDYNVLPDRRYYRERWDELWVLPEEENGETVYYGYISSEVREDIGAPACGLLKSHDGLRWEVLPPPVIEWGELPAQHMELNFCEKIGGTYYLSMAGRFYLDNYGYSLYTFAGESPRGPFKPDLESFRLTGASRRNVTWLGHTVRAPEGLLLALWLSAQPEFDLPSDNFGIGPLKRLSCENGHLRLRYRENNDRAKGAEIPACLENLEWAHPAPAVKTERDALTVEEDGITMSASRDGSLVMLNRRFDARAGFILEGHLTARENRGQIATHQPAAAAGFFFESAKNQGVAMIPDTLGVTRTGTFAYAGRRITSEDIYAHAGKALARGRIGTPQGTCKFDCEDTVSPLGHASYGGIRHGRRHFFRIIARGGFFELYMDDYYVQTCSLPDPFTGRAGLLVFDGACRYEKLRAWKIEI